MEMRIVHLALHPMPMDASPNSVKQDGLGIRRYHGPGRARPFDILAGASSPDKPVNSDFAGSGDQPPAEEGSAIQVGTVLRPHISEIIAIGADPISKSADDHIRRSV